MEPERTAFRMGAASGMGNRLVWIVRRSSESVVVEAWTSQFSGGA
jgi:hypothetical protein